MFDVVVYALRVWLWGPLSDLALQFRYSTCIYIFGQTLPCMLTDVRICSQKVLPKTDSVICNVAPNFWSVHIRARHQHILKITSLLLCGIQCLLMWIVGLQYLLSSTVTFLNWSWESWEIFKGCIKVLHLRQIQPDEPISKWGSLVSLNWACSWGMYRIQICLFLWNIFKVFNCCRTKRLHF